MSWKVDRSFTYEGVNGYYTNKIQAFPLSSLTELPQEIPSDLASLGAHFHAVAKEVELPLAPCDNLWGEQLASLPAEKQSLLWRFREYVFGVSMLFLSSSLSPSPAPNRQQPPPTFPPNPPRIRPEGFRMEDHSFTIVGSSELTSDIDITIQGPRSSFLIALLEDLYRTLTTEYGVPIRCWDVEFYGDFRLLRSVFVNFTKWSNPQRLLLIPYALISYFRSTHQVSSSAPPQIHPNVQALILRALSEAGIPPNRIKFSYPAIVKSAYEEWRRTAPSGVLDRERFYRELARIESDSALLHLIQGQPTVSNNTKTRLPKGKNLQDFAFGLFTAMATANIHRAESYILPSTAIHVVEWEQKKASPTTNSTPLPTSWFASNARVGIDPFGFLLSAIEQLGYLEHYHPPQTACSKKGVKYVGRYLRALLHAKLLPQPSPFQPVYEQLNTYRSTKDPSVACPYNIHHVLQDVLRAMKSPPSSSSASPPRPPLPRSPRPSQTRGGKRRRLLRRRTKRVHQ